MGYESTQQGRSTGAGQGDDSRAMAAGRRLGKETAGRWPGRTIARQGVDRATVGGQDDGSRTVARQGDSRAG